MTASLMACGGAWADVAAAEGNFAVKCIGCHVGGGNITKAGAGLFPEDLKRNGVAEPDAIYQLIYAGKVRWGVPSRRVSVHVPIRQPVMKAVGSGGHCGCPACLPLE